MGVLRMIGSILKDIIERRDINVNELARRTDINAQTLYSMIKRDSMKVDLELLLKICCTLDVPPEVFYQNFVDTYDGAGMPTIQEWELLRKYRSLDEHGRSIVDLMISCETDRVRDSGQPERDTKTVTLYKSQFVVGMVGLSFGTDFMDYEVQADSPADFAVLIKGDSMKPIADDGAVVFVSREAVKEGDIGLFLLNGEVRFMRYSEDGKGNINLSAINRDYSGLDANIQISDCQSLRYIGRVLVNQIF